MTATLDAKGVIIAANISGIDEVFTENLPAEQKTNVDSTIILLTDSDLSANIFGNNDFSGINREIELQIWYALSPTIDPEVVEVSIMKAMMQSHWEIGINRRRIADPDTNQLSKTMYFSNERIIGG